MDLIEVFHKFFLRKYHFYPPVGFMLLCTVANIDFLCAVLCVFII